MTDNFYTWLHEQESDGGRCVNPTTAALNAWNHQQERMDQLKNDLRQALASGDMMKMEALLRKAEL